MTDKVKPIAPAMMGPALSDDPPCLTCGHSLKMHRGGPCELQGMLALNGDGDRRCACRAFVAEVEVTGKEISARCMGCAGPMHGSIGQHIACLERAIADLLGTMRWSKQHLETALEVAGAANPLASPATTVVRALDSKLGRGSHDRDR